MNRLDRMVLVTGVLAVDLFDRFAEGISIEYLWAIFRAVNTYHSEDAFIVNTLPGVGYLSMIPDSVVNITITTNGKNDVFVTPELQHLLTSLDPREVVIFGVMPVATSQSAVEWATNKKNTRVIIREDLCFYQQPAIDKVDIMKLRNPPLIRIFPQDEIT